MELHIDTAHMGQEDWEGIAALAARYLGKTDTAVGRVVNVTNDVTVRGMVPELGMPYVSAKEKSQAAAFFADAGTPVYIDPNAGIDAADQDEDDAVQAAFGNNDSIDPSMAFAPQTNPAAAFAPPDPVAAYTSLGGTLPAAPTVERDIHGVPWDARIHTAGKSKNKDNSWRTKPKTDPAYLAQVTAELMGGNPPVTHAQAAAPPPPPVQVPPAASTPVTTAPPAPALGSPFADMMRKVQTAIEGGRWTAQAMNETVKTLGLNSLSALNARHDLIPQFELLIP